LILQGAGPARKSPLNKIDEISGLDKATMLVSGIFQS
jgi:hypothetical protein